MLLSFFIKFDGYYQYKDIFNLLIVGMSNVLNILSSVVFFIVFVGSGFVKSQFGLLGMFLNQILNQYNVVFFLVSSLFLVVVKVQLVN